MKKYNTIIIGGGIAGLTAAIYLARASKSVAVLERSMTGGQILNAPEVENYPGYQNISGFELIQKIEEQSVAAGAEIIYDNIVSVDFSGKTKILKSALKSYECDSCIIASGTASKPIGAERESELVGSGVSYCAACDGAFFKNKTVMLAGAGGKLLHDANYLSPIVKKLYIVTNSDFKGELAQNAELLSGASVKSLEGSPLSAALISANNGEQRVEISGLFVALPPVPSTGFLSNSLSVDEKGYIIADSSMHTSVAGVFAAGDVCQKSLRQLVTAAADGAIAAQSAIKYLALKNKNLQ